MLRSGVATVSSTRVDRDREPLWATPLFVVTRDISPFAQESRSWPLLTRLEIAATER
jgi:hypothetical protein